MNRRNFSHSFHQFRCCSIRNLPKDGSKFLAHDDAVESTSPSRMLPIRRRLIQQAEARGVARGIRLSYISRLNLHRFRRFFFSMASNINSLLVKDTRSKFFTLLYHGYSILLLPRPASSLTHLSLLTQVPWNLGTTNIKMTSNICKNIK